MRSKAGAGSREMVIVSAVAKQQLPAELLDESRLRDLVKRVDARRRAVAERATKVGAAKSKIDDGNFLTNFLFGRNGDLDDARFDMERAVGALTESSAELLVLNTAMAVVIGRQQEALREAQEEVALQTEIIKTQNVRIEAQQKLQSEQQLRINSAHEGLLEAKGITSEQAIKLVDCVRRVERTEDAIKQSQAALLRSVSARLDEFKGHLSEVADREAERDARLGAIASGQQRLESSIASAASEFAEAVASQNGRLESASAAIQANRAALAEAAGALSKERADADSQIDAALRIEISELRTTFGRQLRAAQIRHAGVVTVLAAALVWIGATGGWAG